MEIEVIKELEHLKLYRDIWHHILHQQKNEITFIEMDWIIAWWKYFGQNHELFILMILDGTTIKGFCPLMKINKRGYKEITFIGYPQASYLDFIMDDGQKKEVIPYVLDYLLGLPGKYMIRFYGLFEDSLSHLTIMDYLKTSGISHFTTSLPCIFCTLKGGFEDYFKGRFSARTRHTIGRKERKLKKLGVLKFEGVDLEKLDEIFHMHDQRWKRKVGDSSFSQGMTKEFFKELAENHYETFQTSIDVISLNGKIISFIYGFLCRGRYIFYRIAHDDKFSIFSPGELVLKGKIEQCFEKGIKVFDFGAGYEPYKNAWAGQQVNVDSIFFPNHRILPWLIFNKDRYKSHLRASIKKSKILVNFKKYTLGKIKYKISRENLSRLYIHWKWTLHRQGVWKSLIRPIIQYEKYDIFHKRLPKSLKRTLVQPFYQRIEYNIDQLDNIIELLGEEPKNIVKKLAMGHRFFVVKYEDKTLFHYWVGIQSIQIPHSKTTEKMDRQECMVYDIYFYEQKYIQELFQTIKHHMEELYNEGYRHLHLGCTGEQKKLRYYMENQGFRIKKSILTIGFFSKFYYRREKK